MQIFHRLGVTDEWTGYRLHGSQLAIDHRATPKLLYNSQIETNKLANTSSCVACHSRAVVNRSGTADCSLGLLPASTPIHPIGHVDYPPSPPVSEDEVATSFIWAFIRAPSLKSGKRACGNQNNSKSPVQHVN
jgi:hypothetical protein